ncbi:MAG: hypothetical protein HOW73_12455 [Polyangiaceae bacterium]|nr:hypothetical protein [Polyangiaceae bacterium]
MKPLQVTVGSFVASLALMTSGCGDDRGTGNSDAGGDSASGGFGAGGSGVGGSPDGGAGGAGGAMPIESCTFELGATIGERCGVFVDPSGATSGDGSRSAPFKSLGEAIEHGRAASYFICNTGELEEAVFLPVGSHLHGNIECETWAWTDERARWKGPDESIAIRILGPDSAPANPELPTSIEGLEITSGAATETSRSPTAIVAKNAYVELRNVVILMQPGVDGADGSAGSAGSPGADGFDGGVIPACASYDGPAGGGSTCGANGGAGGTYKNSFNNCLPFNGGDGLPNQDNGGTSGTTCTAGQDGSSSSVNGAPGQRGMGRGTVGRDGYVGDNGGAGGPGAPGGGGGGGGAHDVSGTYYSGDSGGAGGCGGAGGAGGTYGGSSIALISLQSLWAFENVRIQPGSGGDGGIGGMGGVGGAGGVSGNNMALAAVCTAGDGGNGASGGRGGAGSGGHSAAIAYVGMEPPVAGIQILGAFHAGAGPDAADDGLGQVAIELGATP